MDNLSYGQSSLSSTRSSTDSGAASFNKNMVTGTELWTDGLICAFEFVSGSKRKYRVRSSYRKPLTPAKHGQDITKVEQISHPNDLPEINTSEGYLQHKKAAVVSTDKCDQLPDLLHVEEPALREGMEDTRESPIARKSEGGDKVQECYWVPIGWARLKELVQMVQIDAEWASQSVEYTDEEDSFTVADVTAPHGQRPVGPTWWCHVKAGDPTIDSWLRNAQWLHPATSLALRDDSQLISERMKHLYYEVPVRVAGGLLFELLGQSIGDPNKGEEDVPIVLRSWQAHNFLVTALHVKGMVSSINVLGIIEVQELLVAGGALAPRTAHELVANLAYRLARWDDRLFRKYIFGEADEVELKFVERRNNEDLTLLSIILNQEIRRLSTEVIRVKWSLHAREEIIFELSEHLRGKFTQEILKKVRVSTREMIGEQEAVRDRLFTVQDVMQNNVRAWLQDKSIRITHNISVLGGGGLILSIITGLFGINLDGIPGGQNTPYAFGVFTAILILLGVTLVGGGVLYFGLKQPITEEQVAVRKRELQGIVKHFQKQAENHAKVRNSYSRHALQSQEDDGSPPARSYIMIR